MEFIYLQFVKNHITMRYRLLLLLSALFFCSNFSKAEGFISFKKPSFDFGVVDGSKIVSCEFVFTNTGDTPFSINEAFGSCGCTNPIFPKNPILPGKSGVIKVSYNPKGQRLGKFRKMITVRSDAKNKLIRLYIEGINVNNKQK